LAEFKIGNDEHQRRITGSPVLYKRQRQHNQCQHRAYKFGFKVTAAIFAAGFLHYTNYTPRSIFTLRSETSNPGYLQSEIGAGKLKMVFILQTT